MAVDLINFQKMEEHIGILKSASSDEVKSIEDQILRILHSHNQQIELNSIDLATRDSRKVVNRTGHARFRRGPSDPSTSSSQPEPAKLVQLISSPKPVEVKLKTKVVEEIKSISTGISSGSSSITGEEGTVSNGKPLFANAVTPAPRTFSSGKPPLPTSHRKRCRETELSHEFSVKPSSSRGCHCCKRRKMSVKREIKRVTTTGSSKVAADDIPSDQYSWKKYDQKLIPGSFFPRGYYRCNSAKGCPARKHVERDTKDPTALILTYEGEHQHHRSQSRSNHRWMKLPETLTRLSDNKNNNNRSNSVAGICF